MLPKHCLASLRKMSEVRMSSNLFSDLAIPHYLRRPCWRYRVAFQLMVDPSPSPAMMQLRREIFLTDDKWLKEIAELCMHPREMALSVYRGHPRYPALYEASLLHDCTNVFGGFRWI